MSNADPESTNGSSLESILAEYIDLLDRGAELDPLRILAENPAQGEEILAALTDYISLGGTASDDNPVGTLGEYVLRRQLGRGGMGVVYEAWQQCLDRRVALKILPAAVAADNRAFVRFMREAKTAAQLNHPNIVHVYSVGLEENTPYYAMEYVQGETLAQCLTRLRDVEPDGQTPFGRKESVVYFGKLAEAFADVADGLQHAHHKGVIHRDVKPSNLILDNEGHLRILDFGLARLEGQESLTQSGDFVGTPQYMSPEQARRRKVLVDHRTDIYSLGATIYESVTGRPPFRGKDYADTLSQIIERDAVEARKANPRVPRDLDTIVLKCLRKDAADRYGTAEALAQDLKRFVRGDPVEAQREGQWERFARRIWRNRARWAAVVGFLLLLCVTGALSWSLWKRNHSGALARYEALLHSGIAGLEIGLLTTPGEVDAGETISLGTVDPHDLMERPTWAFSRVEAAARTLQEAVQLLPDRPEAYVHWSRALWALGERGRADRVLDLGLERATDFVPALLLKECRFREQGKEDVARVLERTVAAAVDAPWERSWLEAHTASVRGDWAAVDGLYTDMLSNSRQPFVGFDHELRLRRGRVALKRGLHYRALRDFSVARALSRGVLGPALLLASAYYLIGAPEEGASVLSEALSQDASPEGVLGVISVYLHFGELSRARAAAVSIRDEALRRAAMVDILLREGKPDEAVVAAERARDMGLEVSWAHAALGRALFACHRFGEARRVLEIALDRYPRDSVILTELLATLYLLCEYDQMIAVVEGLPLPERYLSRLGWAFFRKGDLRQALERFNSALKKYPRNANAYLGCSLVYWILGDSEQSVAAAVRGAAIDPGPVPFRQLRMNYSPQTRQWFRPYWDQIDELCAIAGRRGVEPPRSLGFRALACLHRPQPDRELALELAREAVMSAGQAGESLAEALGILGEVHAERGDPAEAVRTLEHALELPGCWFSIAEDLLDYRARLFPGMASSRSVDAFLEAQHEIGDPGCTGLDEVRAQLLQDAPELAQYLEAAMSETGGQVQQAAEILEVAAAQPSVTRSEDHAGIRIRLAHLYHRLGRRDEALALLEGLMLRDQPERPQPWIEWLRIVSSETGSSPLELLERLRSLEGRAPAGVFPSGGEDVMSALKSLSTDREIRINCGGSEYVDRQGGFWHKDRFFLGGEPYARTRPPVQTDRDHDLHYSHRRFWQGVWARPGYRIPLPVGRYEVVLHFCETSPAPKPKRFGINLEGQEVQEPFDPVAMHGFGVPFEKRFHLEVADGALDLTFTRIEYEAAVGSIQVRVKELECSDG